MIGTVYRDEQSGKVIKFDCDGRESWFPLWINNKNRYSKHHLVPFGEYVPLESLLRPLNSVFNLPMSAFQSGDAVQPSLWQNNMLLHRLFVMKLFWWATSWKSEKETDYLLTISNDAWFGDSIGPWQHLQMARMRALELGKPLIRATNTGISVFIDAKATLKRKHLNLRKQRWPIKWCQQKAKRLMQH